MLEPVGSIRYYSLMGSSVDIAKVRQFLREKEARRRQRIEKRLRKAQRDFERIIQLIVSRYGPEKIYQWGSLVHTEHFSEISDIDIAVEGLGSAERYFSLAREAEELTDLPLDLVELEKIHPLHAESIRKKGKLIYERH